MDNRGSTSIGIVLILLLLGVGAFLGALFLPPFIEKIRVPPNHQGIIDKMKVTDTNPYGYPPGTTFNLEPKLADYGTREWGKGQLATIEFQKGDEYYQTTWLWQRYGDTEVAMTIWGPDDTGEMYYLEAAVLGGGPFEIKFKGELQVTISWKDQPAAEFIIQIES